jgi:chemotaxis protein methyltransferase CheR
MQRPGTIRRTATAETDLIPRPAYEKIRRILKTLTGLSLTGYKDSCIQRRLAARVRSAGFATAEDYADFLLRNAEEARVLIKTLTIHVSKFFRNPTTFARLCADVLPELFAHCHREGNSALNIASIGCASGEEPYTLAMVIRETFAEELARLMITITGTDIDQDILQVATRAIYDQERMTDTPAAFKKRYFTSKEGYYHLHPEIRQMVNLLHHDLLRSVPAGTWDLLLCRNVLIYFDRAHQEIIIRSFADALRTGGYLVLGRTETLSSTLRGRFRTVCPIERIYQKR